MTAPSLNTLLPILLLVGPAFTRPSFRRFLTLFAGWVCTSGVHAVTESLVVAGVSGNLPALMGSTRARMGNRRQPNNGSGDTR